MLPFTSLASERRRISKSLNSPSALSDDDTSVDNQFTGNSSFASSSIDGPFIEALSRRTEDPHAVYRYNATNTRDCCLSHAGTVALIGYDRKVGVWNTLYGTSVDFTEHSDIVRQVAISGDGKIGSSASDDGTVRIWNTETLVQHGVLKQSGFNRAHGVALSADGRKVFATFSRTDGESACVVMYQWKEQVVTELWQGGGNVFECFASFDGSRILFVLSGGAVKIMDVPCAMVQFWFDYMVGVFSARMDGTGRHVVIADNSLRVHTVRSGVFTMVVAKDYKRFRYAQCDITADGSRIIETRKRSIIVRDARNCIHILTLLHDERLEICRISADGCTIVACTTSGALVVWNTDVLRPTPIPSYSSMPLPPMIKGQFKKTAPVFPSSSRVTAKSATMTKPWKRTSPRSSSPSPHGPSSAEFLLRDILDPDSKIELTKCVLFKALNTNKKVSLSALFAGHNLLLIALRSGVLDPLELKSFLGIPYFFFSKLYLPFQPQLAHECPEGQLLAKKIFLHAEHLDIIENSEFILDAAETCAVSREKFRRTDQGFRNFFFSINALLSAGNDPTHTLGSRAEFQGQKAGTLTQNLTVMHDIMNRQNRKGLYLVLARCVLSLLPIVGPGVEMTALSGKLQVVELSMQDSYPVDFDLNHCMINKVASVDISNLLIARYLFSLNGLRCAGADAEQVVKQAIEESSFGSIKALDEALKREICFIYRIDEQINLLNLADSRWILRRYVPVAKISPLRTLVERKAGALFDMHVCEGEMMSYQHAITHARSCIQTIGFRKAVSNVTIESVLEEMGDDALRMNKNAFVVACINLVMHSLNFMFPGEDDEVARALHYHLLLQVSWNSKDPEGILPSEFRMDHDDCAKVWEARLSPLLQSFHIAWRPVVIPKWHVNTRNDRLLYTKHGSKSFIVFMSDFIMAYDQEENILFLACPLSAPIIRLVEDLSMDELLDDMPEPQVHFIARRLVQLTGMSWEFDCLAKFEQRLARRLKKFTDLLEGSFVDLEATSLDLLLGCEVGLLSEISDKNKGGVGLTMFGKSFELANLSNGIAYPTNMALTTEIVFSPNITNYLYTSIGGVHNLSYVPKNKDFYTTRGVQYSDPEVVFDHFLKLRYGEHMSAALRNHAAVMLSELPVDMRSVTLHDVLDSLVQEWKNLSDRSMVPLSFRKKIQGTLRGKRGDSFLVLNSGKMFIAKSKKNVSRSLTIGLNAKVAQASFGVAQTDKGIFTKSEVTSLFDAVSHLCGEQPSFQKMSSNWYKPDPVGMSAITGGLALLCVVLDGKVQAYGKFMGAVPAPTAPDSRLQAVCFDIPISYGLTYTTFASEHEPLKSDKRVRDGAFCTLGVELWDMRRNYKYPVVVAGSCVDNAVHEALFPDVIKAMDPERPTVPLFKLRVPPAVRAENYSISQFFD